MPVNKYQTLSEFMRRPFNRDGSSTKESEYAMAYTKFITEQRIRVVGFTTIEDSYYYHLKIPSESASKQDAKYDYDVVIRFFTNDSSLESQPDVRSYFIQFFSNSPGFIYKYAALYKKEGYLIAEMYDKMDQQYANVLPIGNNELSYDKSIYFACRYLNDSKFRLLSKRGPVLMHKKDSKKFFQGINDFNAVKIDQQLMTSEKKLKQEVAKAKTNKRPSNGTRKTSTSKNGQTSIHIIAKKHGVGKISGSSKHGARKSTNRS